MDQLTAYRILQLMPGSTRREIREAYARLAKEYHPEEHPKEFNQIQEAYQLLTDRGENWSSDAVDDWFSDGEKTESEWESEEMCESDTRWKEEEEQEESEESEEAFDEDFKRVMQQKNPGKGQKKTQKIYRKMRSRRLSRKKKLLNRREKIQRHIKISVTGNSGLMRLKKRSAGNSGNGKRKHSEEKWTGRENRKNCRSRPAGQSGIRCMNWN